MTGFQAPPFPARIHHHHHQNSMLLRRLFSSTASSTTATKLAMSNPLLKPCKLALIQLQTGSDKAANLQRAADRVTLAAQAGADIVVLPECFNSPYGTEYFAAYAEPLPPASPASASPSYTRLAALAAELGIHLVAGSIPEVEPATRKLYNTAMVFSPAGALLAKHRKVHLFDIDIPGKITFRESDVLSAGDRATVVPTPWGNVGLAICYDVRFPELAMVAARRGAAFLLLYPGAFNTTTGPLHWELLARARAVDNQVWVGMCSPARNPAGTGYLAWGESMVVDPNGEIVGRKAGAGEETVVVDLDPTRIADVRRAIPVSTQRRFDVYADVSAVPPQGSPS